MTAFTAIQKALRSFERPAVPYTYEGDEVRYFTYNYADNRGADYGDDTPGSAVADVQVHMFLPITDPVTKAKTNFIKDQNLVRKALFTAGFTYPDVIVRREDDTSSWHIIFECEYEEENGLEQ